MDHNNTKTAKSKSKQTSIINNGVHIIQIGGNVIIIHGNEGINTEEVNSNFLNIVNATTQSIENRYSNQNLNQMIPENIISNILTDLNDNNYIDDEIDDEEKIDGFNADNYTSNISLKS